MSQSFTPGKYIQLKSAQSVKWDAIKIAGIIDYLMHGCTAQYTVVYLYLHYKVLKSSVILNFFTFQSCFTVFLNFLLSISLKLSIALI